MTLTLMSLCEGNALFSVTCITKTWNTAGKWWLAHDKQPQFFESLSLVLKFPIDRSPSRSHRSQLTVACWNLLGLRFLPAQPWCWPRLTSCCGPSTHAGCAIEEVMGVKYAMATSCQSLGCNCARPFFLLCSMCFLSTRHKKQVPVCSCCLCEGPWVYNVKAL